MVWWVPYSCTTRGSGVGTIIAAGGGSYTTGVGKKSSSLTSGTVAVLSLIWSTCFFIVCPSNKETV